MNGTNSKEDGAGGGPLSYGQRALWFLQQLEPTNCAYNIAIAGRLTGVLDAGLLEACFRSLVQRHASLHTVFPAIKGKPIQFSRDNSGSLDFNFGQYDASSLAWEDLRERLARECQTPFDLEKGPVLKTMLFRVSEREHVLLLVVHHIAVDYASVVQLVRELGALYAARGSIAAAGLRELTRTYIDYARWQDDMLSGPGGAELWEYWSRQLSGELPVINLPFDRPRQNRQTFRGNTYRFELERRLTAEVRTLARDLRGSPYTVLLAAVFSLLHLYSGQEDVLIGSPPIGRRSGEFDAVVGFFHNPVVLRSVLKPGADFTHVHEEVRRTTELALEHSDYPFSYLVERLKPSRDPGLSPIFQVMFVFYDASVDASLPLALAGQAARIDLGGLDLEFIEIDEAVSMLDLTLTLADENELLSASIQYNTDLFEYSTIEGMSRDLITVLEESAANPGIAIRKLPVAVRRLVACNAATPGEVQFEELRAVEELSEELSNDGARMALSLFWSGGTSAGGNRGLDLLVEAAKFADQNGFQALWLSQDGFSGSSVLAGCSVMAAAVAVLTRRIEIIGRVSFPLASSVRIAEEWSVVDNLSHGRAGVWYAGMVLAAEVPADAEIVQRLWRGETVDFTGVSDKAVPVKTLPRPVKARLPVWVFARDDEGARVAGELEAGLLIDLTMTPIENLSGLIQHYKQAFPARNWSGSSRVVAVAPVYASEDETKCARAISMARKLQCEEGRIILGTPDQCIAKIVELKALGVDEIACRIDFGLDHESILSGFAGLKRIADWSRRVPSAAPALDGVRERARSRREMTRRRHRL